jgi:methylenetetrahydrofolate dehydrogenase (NADP+)/methenyltetrahydrofolate cyclohydrolase
MMEEKLIDGKTISKNVQETLKREIAELTKQNITPGLAVVLIGDNPASQIYVGRKEKACANVGIYSQTIRRDKDISQNELLQIINELNKNPRFHGVLVQLPLPDHINETAILESVNPVKDVDCFHPFNVGKLVSGKPYVLPCTPAGIMELLRASDISVSGKHAVVLGRSNIVGKPMANLLMQKNDQANATVSIAHSRTKDIPSLTRQADILIAAIGQAHFVTASMVKDGVVVIDVGMNRIPADNEKGYKLVGDVHFDEVFPKVSKITPVPGGVGPMTIAMLLKNTVEVAKYQSLKNNRFF